MVKIFLVIHLLVAVIMVGVVLVQRSEGGALGIGGGSSFMTGRQAGNLLTRITAFLVTIFMTTSIILALLGGGAVNASRRSILDRVIDSGTSKTRNSDALDDRGQEFPPAKPAFATPFSPKATTPASKPATTDSRASGEAVR